MAIQWIIVPEKKRGGGFLKEFNNMEQILWYNVKWKKWNIGLELNPSTHLLLS